MDKRGKVRLLIIGILLVSVFLIILIKAEIPASFNDKEYDENTKIVTITNSLSKIKIAEIKLNTPNNNYVIRGKDRKVAEFTIESFEDYGDVFSDMKFFDIKKDMKEFNRDFVYRYKTWDEIKVDDYETICKEREKNDGNGSYIEYYDCYQKQVGSRIEKKVVWNDFNEKAELPRGNITIGIFTDVLPNEHVEWIPTLYGVEIPEWATWTETLNVDLTAYWKFDETSGTNLEDVIAGEHNGTLFNGGLDWVNAKINGGLYYDGTPAEVDISSWDLDKDNFTIAGWFNFSSLGDYQYLMGSRASEWIVSRWNNNKFCFWVGDGSSWSQCETVCSSMTTSTDTWYFVTWRRDGTNLTLWVDGNIESECTLSSGFDIPSTDPDLSDLDTAYYHGAMDELGWWNRSLNDSEIEQLYNNGSGITYTVDTIPPITTTPIINSTDGTNRSNQDLNCHATLTDDQQTNLTAYWRWYKNGVLNLSGTKTGIQNGTPTIITTLDSGNTTKGDNWMCNITPFDGINYGIPQNSSSLIILNTLPTHSQPILNTSTGKNLSTEDLTCYNQTTYDTDNDIVTNIYNWYKNNQSLAVLNLPFEINVDDYSGYDNDGTIYGNPQFVIGKVGNALEFDGIDDYIDYGDPADGSLDFDTPNPTFTIEFWMKIYSAHWGAMVTKRPNTGSINGYSLYIKPSGEIGVEHYGPTWDEPGTMFWSTTNFSQSIGVWRHIVTTHNSTSAVLYVDGNFDNQDTTPENDSISNSLPLLIGRFNDGTRPFNGSIDEVRIYNYSLTPEQISQRYEETKDGLTISSTIVSQETAAGDVYMCQVTPNDDEENGVTLNSSSLEVYWNITFNVTSGEDGSQITSLDNIVCNNTWSSGPISSPFEFGFEPGSYECTFTKIDYYDRIKTFTADDDKTVNVKLSRRRELTIEEHTWLEAIYECIINKDCDMYNLLLEINNTVGNIWEHTKPTDQNVVTYRNVTKKVVNSTQNLTIEYAVSIPIKAGYVSGTYLPVRIGYWFLDENNETCYNQGDKPTGVEDPYCQPLIVETIGPMGGSTSFTVEMRPELPAGDYSIKQMIDIDPLGVWYNYGQETIGMITLTETLTESGIGLQKTGESMPTTESGDSSNVGGGRGGGTTTIIKEKEIIKIVPEGEKESEDKEQGETEVNEEERSGSSWITGGVIGTNLLSGGSIIIIVAILCSTFIIFIIIRHRTAIKIKKKLR